MMKNDDQILEGFNDGYIIQKYEPELAQALMANLTGVDIPYIQGFLSGAKEFILEKELEKNDIFPGMDEDYDIGLSDKDLDKDIDLKGEDFDIDI